MKLSPQEKAAQKAAFRAMPPARKLEHIYLYYKWPILLALIALAILGSALHRQITAKKPVLYVAAANVVMGEDLQDALQTGFLRETGRNPAREEVYWYPDLYLSDDADVMDQEYAYASRIKTMAAIQAQKMDLVLLNRESYDLFSQNGYLLPLPDALSGADPALVEALDGHRVSNTVILEDNSIEYLLEEAESHQVVSEEAENAIVITDFPFFADAGFPEPVYLGILANTPRLPECLSYLAYLCGA